MVVPEVLTDSRLTSEAPGPDTDQSRKPSGLYLFSHPFPGPPPPVCQATRMFPEESVSIALTLKSPPGGPRSNCFFHSNPPVGANFRRENPAGADGSFRVSPSTIRLPGGSYAIRLKSGPLFRSLNQVSYRRTFPFPSYTAISAPAP